MSRKNQTLIKHIRIIAENPRRVNGVGLFVMPKHDGKLQKKILPDITYPQAVRVAKDALAFKFIPYNVVINLDGVRHRFTSYASVPAKQWRCQGTCTTDADCRHLSDVCVCTEGVCW